MTFFKHGFMSAGFLNLSAREAYKETSENDAIIVDVRESRLIGHKRFDVPEIINMPLSLLPSNYQNLPDDIPLIVADTVGLRSHEGMEFLLEKGFRNIANLAGGIVEWERDGMPIRIDKSKKLSGSCVCQLKPRNKK